MTTLTIEFESPHTQFLFGITSWTDKEYATPLNLKIKDAMVEISVTKPSSLIKNRFSFSDYTKYKLIFKNPSKNFIEGITGSSNQFTNSSIDKIYDIFKDASQIFESLLRSTGKVENLIVMGNPTPESIFGKGTLGSKRAYFWLEGENKKIFSPTFKKSKRINPLFSSKQLISYDKWKKIQRTIDTGKFLPLEIDELLKIKAKLLFIDTRRFSVLEAIILIEYTLSQYIEKHLLSIGIPKMKVKDHKSELTLNLMLNILLPSILKKSRLKSIATHISNINNLRKIRNKIMHEKMKDSEIDINIAKKGIDSSIKLMTFLSR